MTHAVIAIDPSMSSTGVAVWLVGEEGSGCVLATSGAHSKVRGFQVLEEAVQAAMPAVGSARWIGVVEKPPPFRVGKRAAPLVAQHLWLAWLVQLARARCALAGERYLEPSILRPGPGDWRRPLGLPTSMPRETLKAIALRRCQHEGSVRGDPVLAAVTDDDAAEAALQGLWAIQCVVPSSIHLSLVPRQGQKPARLERKAVRWAA